MNTLLSVKRDLELGIRPRAFIICPPTPEAPAARKTIKRAPSAQSLHGAAAMAARPTLRRRQPTLTAGVALFERFTVYETPTVRSQLSVRDSGSPTTASVEPPNALVYVMG